MKYKLLLLLLIGCFTGCKTSSKQIGGGYHVKTTHVLSSEPSNVTEKLLFQENGKDQILVWKNYKGPILVEDGTAIFAGATREGDYEIFAVKDGGIPMEIGRPILAFEARRENVDAATFIRQRQINTWYLNRLANGFELQYSQMSGINNPQTHIALTWKELSTIMQDVEAEGKLQKDKPGMSYVRVDYYPAKKIDVSK